MSGVSLHVTPNGDTYYKMGGVNILRFGFSAPSSAWFQGACLWFNDVNEVISIQLYIGYCAVSLTQSSWDGSGYAGMSLYFSINLWDFRRGACLWFNNKQLTYVFTYGWTVPLQYPGISSLNISRHYEYAYPYDGACLKFDKKKE